MWTPYGVRPSQAFANKSDIHSPPLEERSRADLSLVWDRFSPSLSPQTVFKERHQFSLTLSIQSNKRSRNVHGVGPHLFTRCGSNRCQLPATVGHDPSPAWSFPRSTLESLNVNTSSRFSGRHRSTKLFSADTPLGEYKFGLLLVQACKLIRARAT